MVYKYHSGIVHENTGEVVQSNFHKAPILFEHGLERAVTPVEVCLAAESLPVRIDLTVDQAKAVAKALDIFARLSIGQVDMLSEMVAAEEIPMCAQNGEPRKQVTAEVCDFVREQVSAISYRLGYSGNGHSLGIGNEHVPIAGHRAYEVSRVLEKALAEHRDPNPSFRGVNYDGLRLRYTKDPAPHVFINF